MLMFDNVPFILVYNSKVVLQSLVLFLDRAEGIIKQVTAMWGGVSRDQGWFPVKKGVQGPGIVFQYRRGSRDQGWVAVDEGVLGPGMVSSGGEEGVQGLEMGSIWGFGFQSKD